jgi:hypothetical protein
VLPGEAVGHIGPLFSSWLVEDNNLGSVVVKIILPAVVEAFAAGVSVEAITE